jgi:hypothetical protein
MSVKSVSCFDTSTLRRRKKGREDGWKNIKKGKKDERTQGRGEYQGRKTKRGEYEVREVGREDFKEEREDGKEGKKDG